MFLSPHTLWYVSDSDRNLCWCFVPAPACVCVCHCQSWSLCSHMMHYFVFVFVFFLPWYDIDWFVDLKCNFILVWWLLCALYCLWIILLCGRLFVGYDSSALFFFFFRFQKSCWKWIRFFSFLFFSFYLNSQSILSSEFHKFRNHER